MKTFFAPAFWVLGRLTFVGGHLLAGGAFLLPLGLALFPPGERDVLLPVTIALALLALYLLVGMALFMSYGIERLVRLTDRIASGELVTTASRRAAESDRHDSARLWASVIRM
ncbi:MAG TPA: hypothetical protein VHL79_12875, partial [Ramlibacter sp.]|nr:hypothetical protein [Ramlibacter sp.]